ncbi:ParB/RepB/Spo0J family partition protein [aff. Roholtiella sp. LEGE 12411]|uniref:ParB/RepB/Spo0J family partition protein n=1 Tax=aff. Roholtiella sp. LEGE 12411 TaxID=1828822 RepID=UPI00187E5B80|nr:ParB/RepB/Spo0J family partition protein [aff. Roholtiella sp. LEGE 12411]MBE9037605.1 ParB/RepB/Spo0J family partition protein [aff. Roholtiella sp. LEGE 12411]
MPTKRRNLKDFVFESSETVSESQQSVSIMALSAICLPSKQPRRYFDPVKMEQLIQSVKEYGILENLLIRPMPNQDGRYELVAGERRYRAAQASGLLEVPVTIRELTDSEAVSIALVENLQREDLNPVEETEAVLQLLALRLQCTQSEVVSLLYRMQNDLSRLTDNVISQPAAESIKTVFTELGLMGWESFVSNRLPVLKLPEDILDALRSGKIEYTKSRAIARVKNEQLRKTLLAEAIASGLSLNHIKELVSNLNSAKPIQKESESAPVKQRITSILSQVQKTKVWSNPKKQKQLEKLLSQIENLLESD